MTKKNKRSIKVYGMSGYKYRTTPTIMLKGQWLAELGFEIVSRGRVKNVGQGFGSALTCDWRKVKWHLQRQ